ncbi:hypothetical protein [Acinetobacter bereziniae]|uniref:hypothetical protein n=1 Tax=Acinetobacter bereziniae TaxID=106648 RepID=UPI002578D06B|nr:hypothetical protein [Acinetobacter bereziniae]MDM1786829.1 hypothetical protein [Acinetobacter bereziniae]
MKHLLGLVVSWLVVVIGMALSGFPDYRNLSFENFLAFIYTTIAYVIAVFLTKK